MDEARKTLALSIQDEMAKRGVLRFAFVVQDAEGMWVCNHTGDEATRAAAHYYLGQIDKMNGPTQGA